MLGSWNPSSKRCSATSYGPLNRPISRWWNCRNKWPSKNLVSRLQMNSQPDFGDILSKYQREQHSDTVALTEVLAGYRGTFSETFCYWCQENAPPPDAFTCSLVKEMQLFIQQLIYFGSIPGLLGCNFRTSVNPTHFLCPTSAPNEPIQNIGSCRALPDLL